MKPVISHISALEYWRSVRIGDRTYRAVPSPQGLLAISPKESSFDEPGPWWLDRPLHVLVSGGASRRHSNRLFTHVFKGDLPKGAILEAGNGFCVVSPEMCFVQMAQSMDLPHLIRLGYELCGTYDISDEGIRNCNPLTTKKRLTGFAAKAEGMFGREKALRALRYVNENSASPRETLLTMLLCLPYSLGGYGIEAPLLNHRIDLGKKAAKVAGKGYCVCDLYWPEAELAVEYDSDEFHVGSERITEDSSRRMALIAQGVTVLSVTNSQVNDGGQFNGVAHVIASHLGKRLRYKDPAFTKRHLALRESLWAED